MFGHSPERKTPKVEADSLAPSESEPQGTLHPLTLMEDDILRMQRLVGNRATQQLMARKAQDGKVLQRVYTGQRFSGIRNEYVFARITLANMSDDLMSLVSKFFLVLRTPTSTTENAKTALENILYWMNAAQQAPLAAPEGGDVGWSESRAKLDAMSFFTKWIGITRAHLTFVTTYRHTGLEDFRRAYGLSSAPARQLPVNERETKSAGGNDILKIHPGLGYCTALIAVGPTMRTMAHLPGGSFTQLSDRGNRIREAAQEAGASLYMIVGSSNGLSGEEYATVVERILETGLTPTIKLGTAINVTVDAKGYISVDGGLEAAQIKEMLMAFFKRKKQEDPGYFKNYLNFLKWAHKMLL